MEQPISFRLALGQRELPLPFLLRLLSHKFRPLHILFFYLLLLDRMTEIVEKLIFVIETA